MDNWLLWLVLTSVYALFEVFTRVLLHFMWQEERSTTYGGALSWRVFCRWNSMAYWWRALWWLRALVLALLVSATVLTYLGIAF